MKVVADTNFLIRRRGINLKLACTKCKELLSYSRVPSVIYKANHTVAV